MYWSTDFKPYVGRVAAANTDQAVFVRGGRGVCVGGDNIDVRGNTALKQNLRVITLHV